MNLRLPGLLFFALLGAGLLWLTWPKQPIPFVAVDWHGGIRRGDQAASDVVLREYDAQGQLQLLAHAQDAYHLPEGNQTFLNGLSLERFRRQGNLALQAEHGLLRNGDQELLAWGQVLATLGSDSTLRTERLRYDPKSGVIETQDPVFLTHGRSTLQGVGLWASVKTEQFRLLHQVRGTYVP
ncbi:LPS export ABC transporter periplasmic protein LptC [Acidithiobacillus sp. CV18-2]|uniref:LPS export ABC transporter periplasmic protein LptC n=1 Tax=Igneacidithiobacillus copahuensis TaxID=2724909 RepID=A0AAE2YN48_9PROT|nr:LPS export ABC transporter periplasmic protein LptC [Igneacidithiobacillus copahuensis]MBU2753942.1 LPS export ABC transporter periplasmic protein LptC [Acidithiobacillus sp. CV18-3]MBU2756170.1 LPS export ABC transporter periplasmic protein LptC [Acidithiobacillus sp. BN09-2]MBU2778615.1 LPS export ABC transporter periplasmic protein LptC [Acidithiobacillus sp. CV18-2]MBU2797182.1 LPS export ABC transporter periplasmic protein LptC [Acidithiobacillus sp. VAN18-2]MBU2798929.1 LPS export ABC